jgi:hypothetical protein
VKFFNKLEDARELSALINACSRMDRRMFLSDFVLGIGPIRKRPEDLY